MSIYKKINNVQKKVGKMVKDKPGYNYKYFDINQLLEQINPLLEEEELAVFQPLTHVDGRPALRTVVTDLEDENFLEMTIPLPDLQDPQKMGSAITYYRRYSLVSMFALEAEDDDANSAKPNQDIPIVSKEDDLDDI